MDTVFVASGSTTTPSPLYALLGVAIGGMLSLISPLINSILEKNKVKRTIRPNLSKLVYKFYVLKGISITTNIFLDAYKRRIKNISEQIRKEEDGEKRIELKSLRQQIEQEMELNRLEHNTNYRNLYEVEAELFSAVNEVNIYYSKETFKILLKRIQPELDSTSSPEIELEKIFLPDLLIMDHIRETVEKENSKLEQRRRLTIEVINSTLSD
ncbi:MAG: hypothetical protein U0U09_14285 [Cyclobacteriaceae bacterium]